MEHFSHPCVDILNNEVLNRESLILYVIWWTGSFRHEINI